MDGTAPPHEAVPRRTGPLTGLMGVITVHHMISDQFHDSTTAAQGRAHGDGLPINVRLAPVTMIAVRIAHLALNRVRTDRHGVDTPSTASTHNLHTVGELQFFTRTPPHLEVEDGSYCPDTM